ncbi:MAG: peptidoglycan DD-metalloendopeptidase family protein, partial [Catalinimonas sp.]
MRSYWGLVTLSVVLTWTLRAEVPHGDPPPVPEGFDYARFPSGYFLFPIRPGQTNYLAGSMGELRRNHFHGGLDIKTEQRTGLPVYASADGHVYRVRVAEGGYGNAVYLQHPNGLKT